MTDSADPHKDHLTTQKEAHSEEELNDSMIDQILQESDDNNKTHHEYETDEHQEDDLDVRPNDGIEEEELEDREYEKEIGIAKGVNELNETESSDDEGEDLFNPKLMDEDYERSEESEYDDPNLINNEIEHNEGVDEIEARRKADEEIDRRNALMRKVIDEEDSSIEEFNLLVEQQHRRRSEIEKLTMRQDTDIVIPQFGLNEEEVKERFKQREIEKMPIEQLQMMMSEAESKLQMYTKEHIKDAILKEDVHDLLVETLKNFLLYYTETETSKNVVYILSIRKMVSRNSGSLDVSFLHLAKSSKLLAQWIVLCPSSVIPIFSEAATQATLLLYPDYKDIRKQVNVRIVDYTTRIAIRDLRHCHINTLIRVVGIVTRVTAIFPQLKAVKYICSVCQARLGPYFINKEMNKVPQLQVCTVCQSKGPFSIDVQNTIYQNYQKITIQEPPNSVSAGNVPRTKDVILLGDLIDKAQPGEEIDITGMYVHNYETGLNRNFGFPVFCTVIEANTIEKRSGDVISTTITHEEEQEIRRLANNPQIFQIIINSIAPAIYGHDASKAAIALALFGGEQRVLVDKGNHRTRGDINVLLLGDPGTAKSQLLKYSQKLAPRAVFTTGRGSTAVGLTAAVKKDSMNGEWALEGGALVLADEGVCLIDEFDKMDDQDRTSIHEAMEQQSISISKAGIVTSLKARCSVIAAANPKTGKYNPNKNLNQNVNLTEPIISRFDLIMIVRDVVDYEKDYKLAQFVVESHSINHPEASQKRESIAPIVNKTNIISHVLLKKYIAYARQNCHPKWSGTVGSQMIQQAYIEMRKCCDKYHTGQVTARQIEAINRLSEAHAKIHLRGVVTTEDVKIALKITLKSFISCQKTEQAKQLQQVCLIFYYFN
ncbi:hypothetical protein ENUP19_0057G0066 [Entamoeba nuttalli]|uniref:DNA replication licensing factor MCM2 n=1 Tax=Entamoeba nuttalli TaxID=412467 RepID=A0ABQ0DD00_9EUKA